jgi:diketogulonate reductase-like aldo/keto reductase
MPYDADAPLDTQIHLSIASSLHNLGPQTLFPEDEYVDCLLLHSPLPTVKETLQAWKVLETYVPETIRTLGISNVTLPVLEAIYDNATVKPAIVQNRFYERTGYDVSLRAYCKERGITYQSF